MKTLLWIVIALAAGLYICGPVVDPDLWWHITIGRWIIAHRDVPVVDHWTLFGQGEVWRAYSWMIEILFALVDRVGGGPRPYGAATDLCSNCRSELLLLPFENCGRLVFRAVGWRICDSCLF